MLPNIYICKYINTHIHACTYCTHSHQQLCEVAISWQTVKSMIRGTTVCLKCESRVHQKTVNYAWIGNSCNGNWGNTLTAIALHLYINCTISSTATCVHSHSITWVNDPLQSLAQSTTDNYQLLTIKHFITPVNTHARTHTEVLLYIPIVACFIGQSLSPSAQSSARGVMNEMNSLHSWHITWTHLKQPHYLQTIGKN